MILAGAVLLSHADQARCQTAGRDPGGLPRGRCRGSSHGRLGGHHGRAFTDEVIRRTTTKLEVWASL